MLTNYYSINYVLWQLDTGSFSQASRSAEMPLNVRKLANKFVLAYIDQVKKILIFHSLGAIACIATTANAQKKLTNEIDLLKQLSFCICMEKGIHAFGGEIKDMSVGYVLDKMEAAGMNEKHVMPLIEKHAGKAADRIFMAFKDTANIYYDRRGYNALSLNCLEYLRSRSLDSLVRSFKRSSYYSRFDDPALNSKPSNSQ